MAKKKILIIGNGSHVFINYTIDQIKKTNADLNFDLLLTNPVVNPNFIKNYDNIYRSYSNNIFSKAPIIRRFYIRFSILIALYRIKNKYDFVHIHFLDKNVAFFKGFKKIANVFIISIWGSDFYRANGDDLKRKTTRIKEANVVTFTNQQTETDLEKNIPKLSAHLKICRFGLEPLDRLKNLNSDKQQSRIKLGIPIDKIIITIGYNLSSAQQHLSILDRIIELKDYYYYKDLFLVLPITYGSETKAYKAELISVLDKTEIKYKLFEEFLSEKNNAHLRNLSDIMIQLQTTDQFSGSMQEYMYCGDIVITGSWLPYQTLKENGVYYHTIDKFSELSEKIDQVFRNLEDEKRNSIRNKDIIYNISSWETNINSWLKLYK